MTLAGTHSKCRTICATYCCDIVKQVGTYQKIQNSKEEEQGRTSRDHWWWPGPYWGVEWFRKDPGPPFPGKSLFYIVCNPGSFWNKNRWNDFNPSNRNHDYIWEKQVTKNKIYGSFLSNCDKYTIYTIHKYERCLWFLVLEEKELLLTWWGPWNLTSWTQLEKLWETNKKDISALWILF